MKLLKFCNACMLLAVVAGCGESVENVTVIRGGDAVEMSFEELVSDIEIVPLSSPDPVECGAVQIYGDELFMTDMDGTRLWYFKNHTLVSELNANGRGPGEYENLYTISYSPASHVLYVKSSGDMNFLKYEVPSMRYAGKIPCENYLSDFIAVDENRLLGFGSDDESENTLSVIDIPSGESHVCFGLTQSEWEFAKAGTGRTVYSPFSMSLGLTDYVNRLGRLDAEGRFEEVFRFIFSDGMPEDIYDVEPGDMDDMLDYAMYRTQEHYFFGIIQPSITDDGFTFWYCNNNGPEGDDSWLRLFHHNSEGDIQAKDLYISGLNFTVEPDGVTEDGRYYTVICGPDELLMDPVRDQSPLAKRILETVRSQTDDNPVIMYYRI